MNQATTLCVPVTKTVDYQLTSADVEVLNFMLKTRIWDDQQPKGYRIGSKIAAIKWFRHRFETTLYDAKEAVDHYCKLINWRG